MDSTDFDAFTQQLNVHLTRRGGLRRVAVLGLLLGALPVAGIAPPVAAKKRKRRKRDKKKPKCRGGQTACGRACISSTQCCTSATCSGGKTCQDLACTCPVDRPLCPLVSTESCCAPQPGLFAARVSCGTIGGNAVCLCEFRASDVCGAGCSSSQNFAADCADVDREDLDDFCQEIGCEPPS